MKTKFKKLVSMFAVVVSTAAFFSCAEPPPYRLTTQDCVVMAGEMIDSVVTDPDFNDYLKIHKRPLVILGSEISKERMTCDIADEQITRRILDKLRKMQKIKLVKGADVARDIAAKNQARQVKIINGKITKIRQGLEMKKHGSLSEIERNEGWYEVGEITKDELNMIKRACGAEIAKNEESARKLMAALYDQYPDRELPLMLSGVIIEDSYRVGRTRSAQWQFSLELYATRPNGGGEVVWSDTKDTEVQKGKRGLVGF